MPGKRMGEGKKHGERDGKVGELLVRRPGVEGAKRVGGGAIGPSSGAGERQAGS